MRTCSDFSTIFILWISTKSLYLVEMKTLDFIYPDLLFSYWIITWFLIYEIVNLFPENKLSAQFLQYGNPKLAILVAFIENMVTYTLLFLRKIDKTTLVKYGTMIILIKLFPLYLLRTTEIQWINDSIILSILFLIYTQYIHLRGTNIIELYKKSFSYIERGERKTPLFSIFNFFMKK